MGIFVQYAEEDEPAAREIAIRIQKAAKAAQPFFDWVAAVAMKQSAVNVTNNSFALFERYKYLRDLYRLKADEALARKDERIITTSGNWATTEVPASRLRVEAS